MVDDVLDFVKGNPQSESLVNRITRHKEVREESEEESCSAYGYLRGLHEKALALEFQFRSGDREVYPYSWLGPWRYNPSAGLLLKYTGDVTTLVLITGSNLDAQVNQGGVNLTDRGLQRHRVIWIREMDQEEIQVVGNAGPTIDSIEIAEFESNEDLSQWIAKKAPAFARQLK